MNNPSFTRKVLITVAIVAATILLLLFLGTVFRVILIVIAAVLVVVFYDAIARWLCHRLPLSMGWSRVVAVVGVLLVLGGVGWALAPYITDQSSQLSQQLPSSLQEAEQQVKQLPGGERAVQYLKQQNVTQELQKNSQKFFTAVFGFFGMLTDVYVILFMGFLILASPQVYVEGILHLIPKDRRKRGREVLNTLGQTLRSWLSGKLLSMLIVAVLTWVGLLIIGVPLALILGISAGLLAFIPNFGPLIALVLGVIIAATQGPQQMLWTALVYIVVQMVESNLITPVIQRRQVSLPMAMILFAQLVLGVYTGALGLILATPIFAIVMVLVKMLYVEDVLDDHEQLLSPEKDVKKKQSQNDREYA